MARRKVTAAPVLSDWAAVDQALRDIRECQHALTELAVDRDRRLDSIKNEYAKTALPLQNRIKRLESDVKDYVDCHRAEMAGKSRTLNFGTVGYRISSKLMLPTGKVPGAVCPGGIERGEPGIAGGAGTAADSAVPPHRPVSLDGA